MIITVIVLIAACLLLAYTLKVMPLPYFTFLVKNDDVECLTVKTPIKSNFIFKATLIVFSIFKSMKMRQPAIDLPLSFALFFQNHLSGPERAFIDRGSLGDYYVGIPSYFNSLSQTNKTLLIFSSRTSLVFYPIRLVADCLINPLFLIFSIIFYISGLIGFFLFVRLLPGYQFTKSSENIEKRINYFRESVNYFNSKNGPYELGFLLFKVLEGQQFRNALETSNHCNPICEFGIEDGITSTNHLKGISNIDVGCEAIENHPILGDMKYKELVNCYIENNPFPKNFFSTIFLIHVVDHIPDLKKIFDELYKIMSPGANVYFSGFSNFFKGSYLNRLIYQGNIFNANNIEWYSNLLHSCGFKIVYSSNMQSGLSYRLWLFTVFFHHRTRAWALISSSYYSSKFTRFFYHYLIDNLLLPIFIKDDESVSKKGGGLNFMIVASKV